MFFNVWPPLKCTSTPCSLQCFSHFHLFLLNMELQCDIWQDIWSWVSVSSPCAGVFLIIFLIAHFGYLHCPSTCSRCCSSSSPSSGVEQMVRALCERVLITLYLAAILWLLSNGRYRSVWVGFLYTPIVKVPSASGLMMVSRKGMEPSSFASSTVNCMDGSNLFMCWRNSSLCV